MVYYSRSKADRMGGIIMAGNLIIAINRQYGSGGKEIGTKVAKDLGIPIYDQEIPEMAAQKSGIRKDYFEKVDEKPTDSFLYALAMNTFSMNGTVNPFDHTLSSDRLFNIQAEVVKDMAKQGPCVIIGRCGEYILRDEPNRISIYICSPMDKRIERISRLYDHAPISEWMHRRRSCPLIKRGTAIMAIMLEKTGEPAPAIIFPLIRNAWH